MLFWFCFLNNNNSLNIKSKKNIFCEPCCTFLQIYSKLFMISFNVIIRASTVSFLLHSGFFFHFFFQTFIYGLHSTNLPIRYIVCFLYNIVPNCINSFKNCIRLLFLFCFWQCFDVLYIQFHTIICTN